MSEAVPPTPADWWRKRSTGAMLHWMTAGFLGLKLLTEDPGVRSGISWIFAGVAALWILRVLTVGRMSAPGTLEEPWRMRHAWLHRALLAAIGVTAVKGLIPGFALLHWGAIYLTFALVICHWAMMLWREIWRRERVMGRMTPAD
ncbi:MAG: hypothetical protein AAF192_03030 [Pseudomonadota bacterium]